MRNVLLPKISAGCELYSQVPPLVLFVQTSDLWNKRHSVAIGDVHECKLIRRKEVTSKQVDHIWKSMAVAQYVNVKFELTGTTKQVSE